MTDSWAAGLAYEDFMGRWSRGLASRLVSWMSVRSSAHWLDVGCGTGALTDAICGDAEPASVVACDPAAPLIEHARRHRGDPRVSFHVLPVGRLPARPGGFDAIASSLALNFFPDPASAVEEMRSLCAHGGVVAACVWDYAEGMGFLRRFWDAAVALDPDAAALDEGRRFPICQPGALETLFRGTGLAHVASTALELPTRFGSFEDYWRPLCGGTGPAPAYVATLDPARRDALASRLHRSLPRDADGGIPLTARAWAVRGTPS